jgi:hypothetical protein
MSSDVDDLLGDLPPAKNPVGRPTKAALAARAARESVEAGITPKATPRMEEFYKPVGVTFLADVFRMDARTAKKKLAMCPTRASERGGVPLYDFVEAAGYLVQPKVDIATWIKSQRVQDLPPHLAPGVWQAMRHKQAWERDAGQLWETEDVLRVFGATALMMKDRMQLWADTIAENTTMTDDQRDRLMQLVDALQADIHRDLVTLPSQSKTRSSLASLDDQIAEVAPAPVDDEDMIG